ncbi:hypothetical protein C4K02_4352 [Pseudomonas synxantha]|nr:hypothetical protein C4K02_4352 [Pseudomonas synxantha]
MGFCLFQTCDSPCDEWPISCQAACQLLFLLFSAGNTALMF